MTLIDWQVRKAGLGDITRITGLAKNYDSFLMPYILNEYIVGNYLDQFLVAEKEGIVGGAVHYIDKVECRTGLPASDKADCFLYYVKQVPESIILEFTSNQSKTAFLGQIVCPGKGSFYAILEELKKQYDELWCWMSVAGPSYSSYERYGFTFIEERTFWNVYKCDYSTFTLGKWKKEVTNGVSKVG